MQNKITDKKVKKIPLENIGNTMGSTKAFGESIISNLGDELFKYETLQDLLFNSLKQISPIYKGLRNNWPSIEKACSTVIRQAGLTRKVKVSKSTKTGWKEIKLEDQDDISRFCIHIIRIDKLPSEIYNDLLTKTNNSLLSISNLIRWYETQPYIQRYQVSEIRPNNHDEKVLHDFYRRCLQERAHIINFYTYDLKKRALSKSRYAPKWVSQIMAFQEYFLDSPYKFGSLFYDSYFDCRKIDLVGHRLDDITPVAADRLKDIYYSNKALFYKKYFKLVSAETHFNYLLFYLSNLPLYNDRNLIFNELIQLFKGKRWTGFYALALFQIEGLFTEIYRNISVSGSNSKTLTYKVSSLRPFHHMSDTYFDYYEYHIPTLRNAFAHTGYDKDFKLKSYDLLIDLSVLMKVLYEIDHPLVKIKKLHKRRNWEDFVTLREVVDYINLFLKLDTQQKNEIDRDMRRFIMEFLIPECSIEYMCYEMIQQFPKLLLEFLESLATQLGYSGFSVDFKNVSSKEANNILNNPIVTPIVVNSIKIKSAMVEEITNYITFLVQYKSFFNTLKQEIKDEMKKLYNQQKNLITIFNKLIESTKDNAA